MRSRGDDGDDDGAPLRRLRVPAVLAVAFVGTSTVASIWYGGCDPNPPEPGPDAGHFEARGDADSRVDGGVPNDALDASDARPDAPADAAPADAPPH